MSSNSVHAAVIKQETGHCFGGQAVLWRFESRSDNSQRGFTLIELVTIMIIIGILAVTVVPRFFGSNVFQDRGAADQVKAALRYGHKIAIAQRGSVSVTVSSAAVSDCGATLVGGNVNCVISNSVTVVPALPKTVTFNASGQPVPNTADAITVGATVISIEAETGYVH